MKDVGECWMKGRGKDEIRGFGLDEWERNVGVR